MALNLGHVGVIKNNVRLRLSNDFVSLRFVGMSDDDENLEYISPPLTAGWSFYPARTIDDAQVVETVKVSDNPTITLYMQDATALDLFKANGDFVRYAFKVERKPEPYLYEWVITLEPNEADDTMLT